MENVEIKNYNQEVRKKIEVVIDNMIIKFGCTVKEAASMYTNYIYNLENSSDKYIKIYRDLLFSVLYLDGYKKYVFLQKRGLLCDTDIDILGEIFDLEDFNDLQSEISANPYLLAKLVEASYEFSYMCGLGKRNFVRTLTAGENEKISKIAPVHALDLMTYCRKINLEDLIKHIKGQKKYYTNRLGIDFDSAIAMNVSGYLSEASLYDLDNETEDLLKELSILDYKISKYLIGKVSDDEMFIDHVDLYENYGMDEIIGALHNPDYLEDAIWNLMALHLYQEYDGVPLTENLIEGKEVEKTVQKLLYKKGDSQ